MHAPIVKYTTNDDRFCSNVIFHILKAPNYSPERHEHLSIMLVALRRELAEIWRFTFYFEQTCKILQSQRDVFGPNRITCYVRGSIYR
jgi:hypothetical protein